MAMAKSSGSATSILAAPANGRGIANGHREFFHAYAQTRVLQRGREICQRLQYEGALVETRMWDLQIRLRNERITVKEQIQIQGAGLVALRPTSSPRLILEGLKSLQERARTEFGSKRRDGIEIEPLFPGPHGFRLVDV